MKGQITMAPHLGRALRAEKRIAELEAQAELDKAEINAAFNNAEMFANLIAKVRRACEEYYEAYGYSRGVAIILRALEEGEKV